MRRIYCQVLKEPIGRHNSRVEGEKRIVTHFGFVAPGFSPAQPQNAPIYRGATPNCATTEKWTHSKYARQIVHNGRANLRIWFFSLVSMAVEAGPKHGWVTSAGAFSPRLWQGPRTR